MGRMIFGILDQRLAPGLGALLGGLFGHWVWGAPLEASLAAAAGAIGFALIFYGDETERAAPAIAREATPPVPVRGLDPDQGRELL
ncbi:MAG: hypothetical protein AAGI70_10265, partial [Pseudomonadota bacterium]